MEGLWAFILHHSGVADTGGVHSYRSFGAQRLVFGAWAVDALTVATSNKNAGKQNRYKRATPNHLSNFLKTRIGTTTQKIIVAIKNANAISKYVIFCTHTHSKFLLLLSFPKCETRQIVLLR